MAREIAITCYLFIFKIIFLTCSIFPQKKKTTFVASFGDNAFFVAEELSNIQKEQIVVIKTKGCKVDYTQLPCHAIISFDEGIISFIRSIYHLATSKVVFIDNYFGFLSATHFKKNVTCVQLWHAAGAIKKFGLEDPSIKNRSVRANKRFQEVYSRFHKVVVGSEKMALIYQKAFGITDENILPTGIPRTDFFFHTKKVNEIIKSLQTKYPLIKTKKVILYAPTYRDGDLYSPTIALDLEKMYEHLRNDYIVFLRLHPAVKAKMENKLTNFVIDVSSYKDVNHLLLVTDILITDYSSIPFEFSLLGRPMLFFAYDQEEYEVKRGVWEDYKSTVPGPVVSTTEEIIHHIRTNNFDLQKIRRYASEWNKYSTGTSSRNLVESIYRIEET